MIVIRGSFIPSRGKWVKKDILIKDGRIQKISKEINEKDLNGAEVIEGSRCYLFSAFIDPHVHVREPGFEYKEDWETCTRAALKGGASMIMDMPNNRVPITDLKTLLQKRDIALKKSFVNFGLHIALTDKNEEQIFEQKVQDNICGIKVYLSETTGGLLVKSEKALKRVFLQPTPVMVHSGGPEDIEKMVYYYNRAQAYSSNLPFLYFCHISNSEEVWLIRQGKKQFPGIIAEVTPHHLLLTENEYKGYGRVLPPLGDKKDVETLWEGIYDGTIEIMGSDHAPHTVEEKKMKDPPAGFPGLETALVLLFCACMENRIPLEKLLELTSLNARRIFKLGTGGVEEGSPADLVIFEQEESRVGEDGYETKCGWSPFNGFPISFKPVMTILNGKKAFMHGEFYKVDVNFIGENKNFSDTS